MLSEVVFQSEPITIELEFNIGSNFWVMKNNKPIKGEIIGYYISINPYYEREDRHTCLLNMLYNRSRDVRVIKSWYYKAKIEDKVEYITKKCDIWWLGYDYKYQVFSTLQEMRELYHPTAEEIKDVRSYNVKLNPAHKVGTIGWIMINNIITNCVIWSYSIFVGKKIRNKVNWISALFMDIDDESQVEVHYTYSVKFESLAQEIYSLEEDSAGRLHFKGDRVYFSKQDLIKDKFAL